MLYRFISAIVISACFFMTICNQSWFFIDVYQLVESFSFHVFKLFNAIHKKIKSSKNNAVSFLLIEW